MKSQSTGILNLRALAVVSALALPSLALAQTPAPPSPRTPAPTTDTTKPGDAIKPSTDKSAGAAAKLSDADVKIVAHLHHVNQMEIEVGKLAQNNGTMSVKNYGATLIADHQSADQDLTAFAKAHKLATIPADKPQTEADKQDAKDMQAKMAKLKTLKAAEFDREFTTMMTMGHDKELANIDAAIGSVGDPDLKTLLTGVKPVLQRHADQARDLQKNPPQAALTPSPASEQPR